MSKVSESRAIGDGLVADMLSGNLDGVLARLHPNIVVHEADSLPFGGDWTGRDGFANLVANLSSYAELDIPEYTIYETAVGMVIVMQVTLTSRASAATLRTRIAEIYRLTDGLVSEIDVYYKDVKAVLELIGEDWSAGR